VAEVYVSFKSVLEAKPPIKVGGLAWWNKYLYLV